ncbi:hypothetical protein ARALYDRAFT_495500 [Arabidopsis lyrata subsp. lyrata]|uniref:Prolamin-like domain-containing protein n=1 Tax=Arabidopsis lyrata subsp. lyrata TaxID=81972 RepID=D7MTR2_ARALL|nr:hypothetical protein ARALYDRAFT_495500 [Arabidopsis lyrata subsp. lyrata]
MDAKCWPKLFPLNPLFPPLLKDGCSRIISDVKDVFLFPPSHNQKLIKNTKKKEEESKTIKLFFKISPGSIDPYESSLPPPLGAPAHTTPQFPFIPGSPNDLTKCLSSLVNVQGCVNEIHKSVFTGKFGNVGPMCCKAFSAVNAKCWPQMFPFNPFFPPLLKNECSRINAATPTHK